MISESVFVPGDGPLPCSVMLVGEAPGYWETQHRCPFVGKSGQELDRYLFGAGLHRSRAYVTNLVKYQPPFLNGKQKSPSKEDIERDTPRLVEELIAAKPRWIGAVGRFSARWLTGLDIDMESAHGLAFPLGDRVKGLVRNLLAVLAGQGRSISVRDQGVANAAGRRRSVSGIDGAGHQGLRPEEVQRATAELAQTNFPSRRPEDVHARMPGTSGYSTSARRSVARSSAIDVERALRVRVRGRGDQGKEDQLARTSLQQLDWLDRVQVVPIYHPAAGLHNPDISRFVWFDILAFGDYVLQRSTPTTPVDRFPSPTYDVFTDSMRRSDGTWIGTDVRSVFAPLPKLIGIDTEGLPGNVWSLQLSASPGKAYVIRSSESSQLSVVDTMLREYPEIVVSFDNVIHDYDVMHEIGVEIDFSSWSRVEDNMLLADVLGTVPLGHKPRSLRLSGAKQASYQETIAPAEKRLTFEYVQRAIEAKACRNCSGTGKVAEKRRIVDPDCASCDGSGRVAGKRKGTTKFCSCSKVIDQCPSCVDGGLWPKRDGHVDRDWSTGDLKLKTGWEIGRYLRTLKQDIEKGVFDTDDEDDDAAEDESTSDDDNDAEPKKKTIRGRWKSWDEDVTGPIEEAVGPFPTPTLDDIDPKTALTYAARDADLSRRNHPVLRRMVDEQGLYRAYRIDMDAIPAAIEMQRNGMKFDTFAAARISRRLGREMDVILAELQDAVGRPVNPASGDQVAAILFGSQKLTFTDDDARELVPQHSFNLDVEKLTKTGGRGATDDKTLEGLKLKYNDRAEVVAFVNLCLRYRARHKLKSTYLDKIPRYVDKESRVHYRIKPAGKATYRWSIVDPPLHQIPIRAKNDEDLGKLVRECFVAEDGYELLSADFDQVELRILAGISGDDALVNAFRTGMDPHVLGAARTWSRPYDELWALYQSGKLKSERGEKLTSEEKKVKDLRASAKNINFGIVYGITARGLQAQMALRGVKMTLAECQDFIDNYLQRTFPGVGDWMEESIRFARMHGYTESLGGHRRYVPGVWSEIGSVRAEAERQGANFRIQCTGAEEFKSAARDLSLSGGAVLRRHGARLLLGMHDELVLEVPKNETAKATVGMLVESYMTDPMPLPNDVAITAGAKYGKNWGELK